MGNEKVNVQKISRFCGILQELKQTNTKFRKTIVEIFANLSILMNNIFEDGLFSSPLKCLCTIVHKLSTWRLENFKKHKEDK